MTNKFSFVLRQPERTKVDTVAIIYGILDPVDIYKEGILLDSMLDHMLNRKMSLTLDVMLW